MQKPAHLSYLTKDLDWYIQEHKERQKALGQSHSVDPAYNLDQLLKRNKNREYKGVHEFCAAEELGEIVTCVIFKRRTEGRPTEYFHTLYFGQDTNQPESVHQQILRRIGLTDETYQKSLIARH